MSRDFVIRSRDFNLSPGKTKISFHNAPLANVSLALSDAIRGKSPEAEQLGACKSPLWYLR
jgi:hypothetical protein